MTLFPPQEEVINSGLLEKNEHSILNMATGSGKTFLAELAIESVLESNTFACFGFSAARKMGAAFFQVYGWDLHG